MKPENGGGQSKLSATQTMHLIVNLMEKTYSHTHQTIVYIKGKIGLGYTVMSKRLHYNDIATSNQRGPIQFW